MIMRAWIVAGVIMTCAVGTASAQYDLASAGSALPKCKIYAEKKQSMTTQDIIFFSECYGKLYGIIYYFGNQICYPKNVNLEQHAAIIVKYIEERPTLWHLNFFAVAEEALKQAWPCNR
jgi:hypothetical protein